MKDMGDGYQCILLLLLSVSLKASAQHGHYQTGARAAAMGGAAVAQNDEWSAFNNPAGLASIEDRGLLFSYKHNRRLSAFDVFGAAYIEPLPFATASLSVYHFGDQVFSDQKIGLSLSNRIEMVSLGLTANYIQLKFEGLDAKQLFSIDFGGIVSISEKFRFAARITNLNQARISSFELERLPTIMNAGFSYKPIEQLKVQGEIEKDLDFKERLKFGFEYNFFQKFYGRTGFITDPFQAGFGIGLYLNKIRFDYAFTDNAALGDSHQVSIVYQIKKKP